MERVSLPARFLHGGLPQAERFAILEEFRAGGVPLLVATDVSARGIDIPGVPFVVNYDVPDEPEPYVHRIGRTGRGMEKGTAWTFCSPEEIPLLEAIEYYVGKKLEVQDVHAADYQAVRDLSADSVPDFRKLLESLRKESEVPKKPRPRHSGRKSS
jgi:ATP-dependent RNA helicase RhlE